MKEWLTEVDTTLRGDAIAADRLRQLYSQMSSKLIGAKSGRRRDSDAELFELDDPEIADEHSMPGAYFLKFHKRFAEEVDKLCGKNGSQVMQLAKVRKCS